jgi:hypothetical protein
VRAWIETLCNAGAYNVIVMSPAACRRGLKHEDRVRRIADLERRPPRAGVD